MRPAAPEPQITLGRRFHGLHSNGAGLVLDVERSADGAREEVRTQTVVGSDGAASRVAQSAGWPRQETVPLVQAIVELPKDMPAETVRVWFVPDDTPYFYWLIPDSASRGVLGLIGESGQETRKHLERFLEKRKLDPISFQGARIPVYNRWVPVKRRVGAGDVYLVGDAAAQVKVTTVGGIVTGFRGALGVAESIVNRGESPELRRLRRELDMHLLLRRSLHHFQQSDYSRLVDLLNDSARRSLSDYSRDEALKVIWHICLSQPRLLLMGLRGLLTGGRTFAPPSAPLSCLRLRFSCESFSTYSVLRMSSEGYILGLSALAHDPAAALLDPAGEDHRHRRIETGSHARGRRNSARSNSLLLRTCWNQLARCSASPSPANRAKPGAAPPALRLRQAPRAPSPAAITSASRSANSAAS